MRNTVMAILALALSGCVTPSETDPKVIAHEKITTASVKPPTVQSVSERSFMAVVHQMEPIAERECRARTTATNCNFKIVVDNRADRRPNAHQTQDKHGRPVITFALTLITAARNQHELAVVLGHEFAHHIKGHVPKGRDSAAEGAVIGSLMAAEHGAGAADIAKATKLGRLIGERRYSKEFELEADALGTILTVRSGYDALIGVKYFTRIPDPGNRYLGSHPPNAKRIAIVRRTVAKM